MPKDLHFERFVLENGMTVIFHVDRELPLAAVNLWYGVGSKDEVPGRSGFAHLFEHLMFMGTERVPEGLFDEIMEQGGGANNATTSEDRTNYFASGPSPLLPTLLWLEADRLESLGRAMTQEKLDLQRDVVRNERRQSYENQPYAKAWLELPGLLYPAGHPYAHPVIGSHEDLEAASVDDVRAFFDTFYVPRNASLCVAGDFDPAATRRLVQELFGTLENRKAPPRRTAPPPRLAAERVLDIEDEVPVPRLVLAWVSPAHFADGDAELDLVGDLLAEGASSRLEQALLHRRRLVSGVSARQESGVLNSTFLVSATAQPGVTLDEIRDVIDEELARFAQDGPTPEEVERVVNRQEAEFARELQDLARRADQLNMYSCQLGDPGRLDFDLARYRAATPARLRDVAAAVLARTARAALRIVPKRTVVVSGGSARDVRPTVGPLPPWRPPVPAAFTLGGDDRLDGWALERKGAGLVSFELVLGTGAIADGPSRAGLHALLADVLREGAGTRDAAAFSAELDRLGSELRVEAGRTTMVIAGSCLTRHVDATLDLLSDLLERPRLAAEDVERRRSVHLAAIEQRAADPAQVASLVGQRRLREAQGREGHPVLGYKDTMGGLGREDLESRHRELLARLPLGRFVVAGDLAATSAAEKLRARFGALRRGPKLVLPPAGRTRPGLTVLFVEKKDAPQTVIRWFADAVPLPSADTPALALANVAFGGSFTSRLNSNLREEHGYTYGASSRFLQGGEEGLFLLGTSVNAKDTAPALAEILHELERLGDGDFTSDEIEKARASERADQIHDFETVNDTADRLARFASAGLAPDAFATLHDRLREITVEEVNAVTKRTFASRDGVLVLVGDREQLEAAVLASELPAPILVDAEGRPLAG